MDRVFSPAQIVALDAIANSRPGESLSWIRANTLRSLKGLWWEQSDGMHLTGDGRAVYFAFSDEDIQQARLKLAGGGR